MEKKIILAPTYLTYDYTDNGGIKYHYFQRVIENVFNIEEDCLIVKAPTGAGKTFAFSLIVRSGRKELQLPKVLILEPTNSLVHEVYSNLNNTNRSIWTAAYLDPNERRRIAITQSLDRSDIIISNPDIISLLVSNFYVNRNNSRLRQWTELFRKISVICIDEYHSYPEYEMAKIISFIRLAKATGNTHIKYILTSATPNEKINEILKKLNITFRTLNVEPLDTRNPSSGRMLRGEVEIIFTDKEILDMVQEGVHYKGRVMFLANHVVTAEKIIEKLKGITDEKILELTGNENRNPDRIPSDGTEKYIVATNAAEYGLNLNIDMACIEPGLYLENFRQRFGRVGRGKRGEVYVHMDSDSVKALPIEIDSEYSLLNELEKILPQRQFFISKTLNVMSAYIFLVYCSTPVTALKGQIEDLEESNQLFKTLKRFSILIDNFLKIGASVFDRRELDSLRYWWYDYYLRSFGFFRGQSNEVEVELPRNDHKRTFMNIVWMKKNCSYEKYEDDGNIFRIKFYLESPNRVKIKFKSMKYKETLELPELDVRNSEILRDRWKEEFIDFFQQHQRLLLRNKQLESIVKEIIALIPEVLKPLFPELLPPVEVGEVENDLFL